MAEALTTHGVALARLGRDVQARFALQRATEVAHQAGDNEAAGLAAVTMIEEMGERLEPDEMRVIYELADRLLADSEYSQTLQRLRQAARRILAAERARRKAIEDAEISSSAFVYRSKRMAAIMRDARRIAGTMSPVLITGEAGTGKELLARVIHGWSGLAGEFVAINCAALAEAPVESGLFGRRKGDAEDDAEDDTEDERGAVRRAAGGTLFLDEIAELSTSNQARLLRLIERGEIQSMSGSGLEHVEVRIIAATNCNLKEEVERELFREDLFYRLQSFHLEIPPLRERTEDIPVLAEHFIREALERHGQRVAFTPEAVEAMSLLPLKGNARELQELIERTVSTAVWGTTITRNDVETLALRQNKTANLADVWAGCSLSEEVKHYEGSLIQMALDAAQGHVTHAAHMLGVTHQGLAYILEGRHKDLLHARKPVRRRRRSIIKKKRDARPAD
ncbi:MAG TPA: sigma 54-interacting transcriptional regulator [Pyrinomonadaceae bacterium]